MERIAEIQAEIDRLMGEATGIARRSSNEEVSLDISGNRIIWDNGSWVPGYDSDWYSSSADC